MNQRPRTLFVEGSYALDVALRTSAGGCPKGDYRPGVVAQQTANTSRGALKADFEQNRQIELPRQTIKLRANLLELSMASLEQKRNRDDDL